MLLPCSKTPRRIRKISECCTQLEYLRKSSFLLHQSNDTTVRTYCTYIHTSAVDSPQTHHKRHPAAPLPSQMTTSKGVKKDPTTWTPLLPDSMALYGNFGAGHARRDRVGHHEPKGASYTEANQRSNSASITNAATQDLSESSTESETSPRPVIKK